jgi:hypothetical protein
MDIAVIKNQSHLDFLAQVNKSRDPLLREYPLFNAEYLCINIYGRYQNAVRDAKSQYIGMTFSEWASGLEEILQKLRLSPSLDEDENNDENPDKENNSEFYWPE